MKHKNFCYLLCTVKDDLPVGVFDTYNDIETYLDISAPTVWRMIKEHTIVKGMYVEKVYL